MDMNPTETSRGIDMGYLARFLGCEIDEIDDKLRSMSTMTEEQFQAKLARVNQIIDDIRAAVTPEVLANLSAAREALYDKETGLPV